MKKEQIKKEYMLMLNDIRIGQMVYTLNKEHLEECFEEFYTKLSNIIKVSNIENIYIGWKTETITNDDCSITADVKIRISSIDDLFFELRSYIVAVKTSQHIAFAYDLDEKKSIHFPKWLGMKEEK